MAGTVRPLPFRPVHDKSRLTTDSHYKSWKMTALLPWGALFYVAGLVTREAGSYVRRLAKQSLRDHSLTPFISSFFPANDGLFIASRVLILDATYHSPFTHHSLPPHPTPPAHH